MTATVSTLSFEAYSSGAPTNSSGNDRIGFVGLGNMGAAMCTNLVKWAKEHYLPPVTVWNRSLAKTEPFREMGCIVAQDLKSLGASCDLILTSLASDSAAKEVYAELFAGSEAQPSDEVGDGVLPGGRRRSTIFVDTSTLYPELVGRLEREASKMAHRFFLSCPVFGPPPLAVTAQLVIVISGEYHARTHAEHFLVPSIARKSLILGSNVETAATFKLIGNSMILGTIELLAESMTLADKTGVGAETLYQFIEDFFPAPSFLGYGKKIINDNFDGSEGFTLEGGIKDASLIRRLAESSSTPMPIVDVAHQHLLTARANGGSSLDWSSAVGGQRIASGMHPFKRSKELMRYSEAEGGGPPTRMPSRAPSPMPGFGGIRPERIP